MHFQEFNMKNQMQHEQSSCVLNNKKKEIPCRNKLPAFGQYFTITDKIQKLRPSTHLWARTRMFGIFHDKQAKSIIMRADGGGERTTDAEGGGERATEWVHSIAYTIMMSPIFHELFSGFTYDFEQAHSYVTIKLGGRCSI